MLDPAHGYRHVEPVSALKRAAELLARLRKTRNPIVITQNGQAAAVLQDIDSDEEERRAFALLQMCLDGERAIEAGKVMSVAQFKSRRHKRMAALAKETK